MSGFRRLSIVVAILVILAGCSGMPGGTQPTTTTESSTNGAQSFDPGVQPLYSTPFNATDVAIEHTVALREAGSFTYSSVVSIGDTSESTSYQVERTARVEMDTKRILVHRNTTGIQQESVYSTGNGTTYLRTETPNAGISYNTSQRSIDTARYAIDGVPDFLNTFTFSYDGAVTAHDQKVYKYTAVGPDNVVSPQRLTGQAGGNLTDIQAYAYVTESGIVKRLGYNLTFETGEQTHVVDAETTYSEFGSSAVTRPNWVSNAEAAAAGNLTETRTIENETLGATLQVTANPSQFEEITIRSGPGPFYTGNNTYEEAAASSAVVPLFPPGASNATFTIEYDPTAVPSGEESELALYRYAVANSTWEPINATQDEEANTFRVNLSRSNSLVVMHEPTWKSVAESDT